MSFIDTDLQGRRIDQRSKDSRSVEVEGRSRFCGKRFLLKTHLFGDKRCLYCGKWFHWTEADCLKAIRGGYTDPHNLDNVAEPLHCGSSHCVEYHHLCQQPTEWQQQYRDREDRMFSLFQRLQKRGIVV